MTELWTIGALLQWTQRFFAAKGIDTARLDAELLLAHVLQKERIYLYAHYDEPLSTGELAAYRELVRKRGQRFSVAHLLGTKSFMGLKFSVTEDVLVPRPETELLVEAVLEREPRDSTAAVLDIGTGSGAIVLSICHYLPQATGLGVDISAAALAVAAKNGASLDLPQVRWQESDLTAAVGTQTFDWILSNPPYLTAGDMAALEPEVRHDPQLALFGGPDGLAVYRRLAAVMAEHLKPGGHCAVEIGSGQRQAVAAIFAAVGNYSEVTVIPDYGGIERVLIWQRKERI